MARDLDIILFGATGFTGKHAVPILHKLAKARNRQLTWGIAGRSAEKLKDLLSQCEKEIGISLANIPIIIADIQNEQSLSEMARKTRIIINCCGPYRFFGEPVVKACVEEGTHHVDVSGELQYIETMQLKYNDQAKEKGVYIVSACGFDSIPTDLGIVFLQQKFEGTLNSVETYLDFWEKGATTSGSVLNYGTWESAIYELANTKLLVGLRKKLFPNRLPRLTPKLQLTVRPHQNDIVSGWILPFLGSDHFVANGSQYLFYEKDEKRPVQVETYFLVKTFWSVLLMLFFGLIFQILVKFKCSRNLLLKYPEKFSAGFFSRAPPSEEKIKNSRFSITFYGEGWNEKLPGAADQFTSSPNKAITAKVKGSNPGYGATNVCLVLAAVKIITETDKMPPGGGVFPPGYAFANTSIIEELQENEVTFDVLMEKNLPSSKY